MSHIEEYENSTDEEKAEMTKDDYRKVRNEMLKKIAIRIGIATLAAIAYGIVTDKITEKFEDDNEDDEETDE